MSQMTYQLRQCHVYIVNLHFVWKCNIRLRLSPKQVAIFYTVAAKYSKLALKNHEILIFHDLRNPAN